MPHATLLQTLAEKRWESLAEQSPYLLACWTAEKASALKQTLALSDFIFNALSQAPDLLTWLHTHEKFEARQDSYRQQLSAQLTGQTDENAVMRILRHFRRQEMLWLAWQDFTQQVSVEQSLVHLSSLAEAMIMAAYDWLYADCCQQWGTPVNAEGKAQHMLILGMGKLGGCELNFSSDIDLIFTYPENGETQGGRRSLSNAQFFTRLGQRLIKLLDQQTIDGFCYRVDMRLRPFGESGPLVMSFSAIEDYYQEQGRDWERYAMIKTKVMGREQFECYQTLRALLRPFVFRRYIDFSAIQALRRMKAMIQREVRRRGLSDNIKLGAGGIREIEFIAQSFQLIRGGREPSLRKRSVIETLKAIGDLELMPIAQTERLIESYYFLRRVENVLQAIDDKQTQTLPSDEKNQGRLLTVLGFSAWENFVEKLNEKMRFVHHVFDALIGDEEDAEKAEMHPIYQEIWDSARSLELTEKVIEDLVTTQSSDDFASDSAKALAQFKMDLSKRTIGPRGREVLNRFMPKLLHSLLDKSPSVQSRIYGLLNRIVTRTTYLELLDEHPIAVNQLLTLSEASPRVAEQLATYPMLLDELLDPQILYHPTPFTHYRKELFEYLARIPEQDMEQQMEMIRQFKQTQLLRIAAADIADVLPVMQVSDHLTYLAEAIIEAVVNQAWGQIAAKYGEPLHLQGREGKGFAVIGYGKLGGIELGYGSDLDIVFVHDCPDGVVTDGEKVIDGRQFYLRLAQRIVHLFSTRTASGVLYEIDTRLRPSGASGMLVTSLESFAEYQSEQAWVWEHQALVRTRVVYGDALIRTDFDQVRHKILTQSRDKQQLKQDVEAMREKMRSHLSKHKTEQFNLKQDRGGITDIEFITQYLVLANSHETPELTRWSDNVRIFEALAKHDVIDEKDAQMLISAYVAMRDNIHHLSLKEISPDISSACFVDERKKITAIWQTIFFE